MSIVLLVALVILNIPIYLLLGKSVFGGWTGFLESIVAIFQSDLSAAASGSYEEHRVGKFTLLFFVLACIAIVAAEYHVIAKFILGMERPWG